MGVEGVPIGALTLFLFHKKKKSLLQAKAFTKLLRKVLSKRLRKNLLRRKPVLKEKIIGCLNFRKEKCIHNFYEKFPNTIFILLLQ